LDPTRSDPTSAAIWGSSRAATTRVRAAAPGAQTSRSPDRPLAGRSLVAPRVDGDQPVDVDVQRILALTAAI